MLRIILAALFVWLASGEELAENKTLLDQLIGKMNPSTPEQQNNPESNIHPYTQLTKFIVYVLNKEGLCPFTKRPCPLCYGCLINQKTFVSIASCVENGFKIAIPSGVSWDGKTHHYPYSGNEPMPPYLAKGMIDDNIDPWPALIPVEFNKRYDWENKPATRVTLIMSKNPQQIEVLIQTMDEEIIFVPKTRITDELKPCKGDLLFVDSYLAGILIRVNAEKTHYEYAVVKENKKNNLVQGLITMCNKLGIGKSNIIPQQH